MARKPRIEFEGAFYHVITRGNQRQKIFRDKDDFLKYIEILSNYKTRYKYSLYAYILMNNHIHLLAETQEIPLSKILQGINQSYTTYFNRKYKTVGHLFQGRYKAILCDRDEYLVSLVKYIHLNPVRAKMVKSPDEYQWSSHHSYIKKADGVDIIDTDQVLRMFSEDKQRARKLYRAFMSDGSIVRKENIYNTIGQRILGSEEFLERVMERYDGELKKEKREREYTLYEIAKGVEKIYGVRLKQIREKSKSEMITLGRRLLSLVATEYGYKGKEIGLYIRKDPAIVTRDLKEKIQLEREMEKVLQVIRDNRAHVNTQV
jgi:REP element-mobilizing transposase RayT